MLLVQVNRVWSSLNWMPITSSSPLKELYSDSDWEWVLDYHSLFHWIECHLAELADFVDTKILEVSLLVIWHLVNAVLLNTDTNIWNYKSMHRSQLLGPRLEVKRLWIVIKSSGRQSQYQSCEHHGVNSLDIAFLTVNIDCWMIPHVTDVGLKPYKP